MRHVMLSIAILIIRLMDPGNGIGTALPQHFSIMDLRTNCSKSSDPVLEVLLSRTLTRMRQSPGLGKGLHLPIEISLNLNLLSWTLTSAALRKKGRKRGLGAPVEIWWRTHLNR